MPYINHRNVAKNTVFDFRLWYSQPNAPANKKAAKGAVIKTIPIADRGNRRISKVIALRVQWRPVQPDRPLSGLSRI
jgi:hypothetical protein